MAGITAQAVGNLRKRTGAGMMDCKKALTEAGGDEEKAIKLLKDWGIAKAAKKSGRGAEEGMLVAVIADDKKSGALVEVNCETDFVANTNEYKQFALEVATLVFTKGFQKAEDFDQATTEKISAGISQFGENILVGSIQTIKTKGILSSYVHTNYKIGTLIAIEGEGNLAQDAIETLGKDLAVHVSANAVVAVDKDSINPDVLKAKKEEYAQEVLKSGKPENMVEKIVLGKLSKFYKDETLLAQPFLKNEEMSVEELVGSVSKETGITLKVVGFIKTVMGE